MDILEVLKSSIDKLPIGDYSPGLSAVVRHLECAIRHYQRNPTEDADCYTDSVYRTNQAYEGSVKEAYRVLAEKDPSKKTPFEIESHFDSNGVLRSRALTQLMRYRQDYRNPSAHDYKLDFDANEALLAILSVSAFGKLLVDQILEKIAYNKAAHNTPPSSVVLTGENAGLLDRLAKFARDFCDNNDHIESTGGEFSAALAGSLASAGVTSRIDDEGPYLWDIIVEIEESRFAIECRIGERRRSASHMMPVNYLNKGIHEQGLSGGIIVSPIIDDGNYSVFRADSTSSSGEGFIRIVTKLDRQDVMDDLGPLWSIS